MTELIVFLAPGVAYMVIGISLFFIFWKAVPDTLSEVMVTAAMIVWPFSMPLFIVSALWRRRNS